MASATGRLKLAAATAKLKAAAAEASSSTQNGVRANKNSPSATAHQNYPKVGTSKLRSAALALKITGATSHWGEYNGDISMLSNEKLKRHLRARNEVAEGTKLELIERLNNSIEEERQKKIAIELELEAKHRKIADLEEQGAIYVVGKNNLGQLGLGDLRDRYEFAVIPCTRGKHFRHVSAGGNIALATTEQHEVYAWGGAGLGPTGLNSRQKVMYRMPQLIEQLNGEEVIMTSVGANHACAASEGGDLFVWGFGVLGLGDDDKVSLSISNTGARDNTKPQYVDAITVSSIECGEMHTCVKTNESEVYTWGLGANGRLGHETKSIPFPVKFPPSESIRLIACGSEHTLICTKSAIYAFGVGDGGRLGLGDGRDRSEPCEIKTLRGSHILSMSAGTWHSACVVHVAPLDNSGWLFSWGSGFHGQLGLDKTCKAATPTIVQGLINEGLSVKMIFCGSHHNAAICNDDNLYTWGSNQNGALGRTADEPYTPHPGIVPGFGTIVKRIGRGLPLSVACGREYTVVATYPYDGPTEEEALKLAEEQKLREEAEYKRQDALMKARKNELKRLEEIETEKKKIEYLTSKRLCTMDPNCPGFTYEPNQPSICRECGFSVTFHTVVAGDERDETNERR